jgi:predicted amidohydrolase
MTANRNLKRRVRARAAKTGESYAAALRHVRPAQQGGTMPEMNPFTLATAQVAVCEDPSDSAQLRQSGRDVRDLMRQAREAGARIIHFPEGATCSPHKRVMSATGPAEVGPADWDRADWQVLREELAATARLAGELRLWTVLGSVHPLTPPHRPHNSMHVISDRGGLVTRYDERLLSNTKLSFMYTPGSGPVTFEVDGLRFGCALGIEVHYPEVFAEYERLGVDGVLFSTTGPGETSDGAWAFAAEAQAHAATNTACGSASPCPRSTASPPPPGSSPQTAAGSRGAQATGTRRWPSPASTTGPSPSTSPSPRPARGGGGPEPGSTPPTSSPISAATTAASSSGT